MVRWDFCGVPTPGLGGSKLLLYDSTSASDRSPQKFPEQHNHRSNEIWRCRRLQIHSLFLLEALRRDFILPRHHEHPLSRYNRSHSLLYVHEHFSVTRHGGGQVPGYCSH